MRVLDITADQFGLPAIVTGIAPVAQYRSGQAKPLSDGARAEAGCIERWIDAWRLTGGVATPSPMNAASMAGYAGPSAGALALLLHEETGIPIHLAYADGKPPHPVVWDGSHALDARGFTGWEFIGRVLGAEPGDLVATDPAGLRSVLGPVTSSEVEAAYGFALCHPALGEALRQARYSRMPDGPDEPDDEMGMDAPAFSP